MRKDAVTIETSEAREYLRGFLQRSLGKSLSDDDDIFLDGGATSLFAMELVMFIEKSFEVSLGDSDLERENFTTIDAMARLIGRKRSQETHRPGPATK
jgi:acyl carrier protein